MDSQWEVLHTPKMGDATESRNGRCCTVPGQEVLHGPDTGDAAGGEMPC